MDKHQEYLRSPLDTRWYNTKIKKNRNDIQRRASNNKKKICYLKISGRFYSTDMRNSEFLSLLHFLLHFSLIKIASRRNCMLPLCNVISCKFHKRKGHMFSSLLHKCINLCSFSLCSCVTRYHEWNITGMDKVSLWPKLAYTRGKFHLRYMQPIYILVQNMYGISSKLSDNLVAIV